MPNLSRSVFSSSAGEIGDNVVTVPIDGGPSRQIKLPTTMRGNLGLDVHPDGKHIAYVSGTSREEVWVIENFLPDIVRP